MEQITPDFNASLGGIFLDDDKMQNLLTEKDREWLHGLGLNLSTWRELTCAKFKGSTSGELMSIARRRYHLPGRCLG
jgi:hypothetical protein